MVTGGQRVAVVTGGTAGVGRAAVREFARRGYDVAILARGAAGLEGAAADVRAEGRQALPVQTDVADYEAVKRAAATIESDLGEIDVWVNVAFAGTLAFAYLAEHPRRNMWVGVSTAYTILGERMAPKLLDLYLGRSGVKSQQTGKDLPRLGSNLFEPRDQATDAGAHGPFDGQAHGEDLQLWLSVHRRAVLASAAGAIAAAAVSAVAVLRR